MSNRAADILLRYGAVQIEDNLFRLHDTWYRVTEESDAYTVDVLASPGGRSVFTDFYDKRKPEETIENEMRLALGIRKCPRLVKE